LSYTGKKPDLLPEGKQIDLVSDEGAEEYVWTQGLGRNRRLEKINDKGIYKLQFSSSPDMNVNDQGA
jgi:hypothetical protein